MSMHQATAPRYSRQVVLRELGVEGQQRLLDSAVLVVGCGALGGHIAQTVVRAGVGRVGLLDRDFPELHNLQRQVLFDEDDVAAAVPKAQAAARRLRRVNSDVIIEPLVTDLNPRNVEALLDGFDLVLDGTDNFETRYVLNDACVKLGVPWIYGGVLGTMGTTMSIVPGQGPCLRCLMPEPPPPGSAATCETAGVLNTLPAIVAALQCNEAFRILTGAQASRLLVSVEGWDNQFTHARIDRRDDCLTCVKRQFTFLDEASVTWATRLCGSNLVQVEPPADVEISLPRLQAALATLGPASMSDGVLRFEIDAYEFFIFDDGRAIVRGTTDVSIAKSLYAKYVGA
jgi:adenylyltransferase/sulfurtransferase